VPFRVIAKKARRVLLRALGLWSQYSRPVAIKSNSYILGLYIVVKSLVVGESSKAQTLKHAALSSSYEHVRKPHARTSLLADGWVQGQVRPGGLSCLNPATQPHAGIPTHQQVRNAAKPIILVKCCYMLILLVLLSHANLSCVNFKKRLDGLL